MSSRLSPLAFLKDARLSAIDVDKDHCNPLRLELSAMTESDSTEELRRLLLVSLSTVIEQTPRRTIDKLIHLNLGKKTNRKATMTTSTTAMSNKFSEKMEIEAMVLMCVSHLDGIF